MRLDGKRIIMHIGMAILATTLFACGSTGKKSDTKESANIHLQLGVRYLGMDKLSFAKEHLEKAHDLDSGNAEVLNALAFLYEKLRQPEVAEDYYEDALDSSPDDLSVLNNFGRFLCEQGEYEKGLTFLKQSIASPFNDRQWLALTNAGRCEMTQDHIDAAESYFRQTLQLQAFYAPALLEMQKVSYLKAEYWDAKGFLERYLSVGQHTPETLWYAYQTERALGNRSAAEGYRKTLLEAFPLSKEAKKVISARKKLKNDK